MGNRSWTDSQLSDIVERARSWRGVLAGIGLKPTSAGSMRSVQKRARELGLNTDHFTRNRTWTDRQLREAVESSKSWSGVIAILELTYDGQVKGRLKGHAARLGLETEHLDASRPQRPLLEYLNGGSRPAELRTAAPTVTAAWFALRGLAVALPSEPQPYDLLVAGADEIYRVQVKSTTSRARNGHWQVGIAHRPNKAGPRVPYDPDSVDLFVVITGDGGLYVIPIEAVAGYTAIYLSAYEDYRVGDVSSLMNGPPAYPKMASQAHTIPSTRRQPR